MGKKATTAKTTRQKAPIFIGLDEHGRPPEFPSVRPSQSSIHNRGLFAAKDIAAEEYIIQYLGERLTKKESNRRGLAQHELASNGDTGSVYIFELNDRHDIDGNYEWNICRLANHSCSPNCEAQNADGEIWLVALRDIKAGEEITFDYGYALEHWQDHPCRCGSSNCVGYIVRREDWGKLKRRLRRRLSEKATADV